MNNQEIFSKVRKGLLSQMERSLSTGGSCRYRGAQGYKCAIGQLIPDEFYDPEIEGIGVVSLMSDASITSALVFKKILDRLGIDKQQYQLLKDLQSLHDVKRPSVWEVEFAKIADVHGLKNE